MKLNVGTIDRGVRIVAGLAAIALGVYYQSWWGAIGLVPLVTAFVRWCPAYNIFGISSCGPEGCKAK
jgi:type IV secretory pathway TrbD component